jgi:hypothetical protein
MEFLMVRRTRSHSMSVSTEILQPINIFGVCRAAADESCKRSTKFSDAGDSYDTT